MRKAISIYQLFNTYSKEEIDRAIATLKKDEQELIKLRYGEDLENPTFEYILSEKQNYFFYKKIIPKIKRRLKNPNRSKYKDYSKSMNIYEYFSYYTREEVDSVIATLKEYEVRLLKLYCGEDYEGTAEKIELRQNEKYYFLNTILTTMHKKLNNTYLERMHSITKNKRLTIYEYFKEYSKEEIDRVIQNLSEEEQELLKLKFASVETLSNEVEMTPEQIKAGTTLTTKIKYYLNNPHLDMNIVGGTCLKSIYKRLDGYTKEQIDAVITLLTDEDRRLLELRYGPDLCNPIITEEWDQEAAYKFNVYLMPKIKRMLKNPAYGLVRGRKAMTIYRYFSNYSNDQVDAMLSKLNEEEKRLLNLKYGSDLDNPLTSVEMTSSEKYLFEIVKKKMGRLLENPTVDSNSYILVLPEIYNFFAAYPTKDVDEILASLNEEEQLLLYLKFGKGIDHCSEVMLTKTVEPKKYKELLQKIKYLLNKKQLGPKINRRLKNIYDCFSEYERSKVDQVIAELSNEEIQLLHKKYGSDLENPVSKHPLSLKEKGEFRYLLIVKMKKRLEEITNQDSFTKSLPTKKIDTKITFSYLVELLNTPNYAHLLQQYSIKEAMIILLKFGLIDNQVYSKEEIASYLGIETGEVIEVLKRYLEEQKEKINGEDKGNQKVKK